MASKKKQGGGPSSGPQARPEAAASQGPAVSNSDAVQDAGLSEGLGTAVSLPYLSQLEAAFGGDLSGVRAHTGSAAAAKLGVSGFARGEDVVFRDEDPSLELVAHEVTHWWQQNAEGESSGGSAEVEAERVAANVVGGGPVDVGVREGRTLRFSDDDPSHMTNDKGEETTSSSDPVFSESSDEGFSEEMLAKVLTGEDAPLISDAAPDASELYDLIRNPIESVAGYQQIMQLYGSVDEPHRKRYPIEDSLFIGGAPAIADIEQGNLGSCFFLATLTAVVSQDASHISEMITGDSEGATVQLYHHDGAEWVRSSYTVSNDLEFKNDDGELLGNELRFGDEPVATSWYSKIIERGGEGMLATIASEDYEMALWAPLMEKAFAAYAQQHGNDGRQALDGTQSGWNLVDEGGEESETYPIFYGPDAASGVLDLNTLVGAGITGGNVDVVRNLLRLQHQNGGTSEGDKTLMITASADDATTTSRLNIAALNTTAALHGRRAASIGDSDAEEQLSADKVTETIAALATVSDTCTAYAGSTDENEPKLLAAVRVAAEALTAPGAFPILESPASGGDLGNLLNQALIATNFGEDASPDRRSVFTSHAYNILGVALIDQDGAVVTASPDDFDDAKASEVDVAASKVRMRNPHGTNEPDRAGDGADDGKDEGIFLLTLQQFLTSFSELSFGEV